ncbi:polyadenylate-binding protein 1 [Striga asiatica]|uniref:Polyadenylate-binding protein 1 n=1 Tax=Striga asiatica TaxID=4170 RepID=A0A5A7RDV9_STRAF|nr:polyadenylate-binding protein 1 [Striga asiatica]
MEGDVEMAAAEAGAEGGAAVELDDMKKRLKEMEDEAAALREMQAKVEQEMGSVQGSFLPSIDPILHSKSLQLLCQILSVWAKSAVLNGAEMRYAILFVKLKILVVSLRLQQICHAMRYLVVHGEEQSACLKVKRSCLYTIVLFDFNEGDPASASNQANREEVDSRSVFVGNVDYACTPEEVQQHFQSCGTVNRVTIRTNKYGQPKGYAYVEFLETEAVEQALLLNESELHGRQLKVSAKRTNVPGMKQFRPRRSNPYLGSRPRVPYIPAPYIMSLYGYGKVPRFRVPMRYSPYF